MAVCCSHIVLDKKVQRVTRLGSTHVSMVHKKEVPIQCALYLWAISSVFLGSVRLKITYYVELHIL